jgi:hypothetical protein
MTVRYRHTDFDKSSDFDMSSDDIDMDAFMNLDVDLGFRTSVKKEESDPIISMKSLRSYHPDKDRRY